jgi:hypothetical protein
VLQLRGSFRTVREERQLNNTQLYLIIGLPMLTVILAWLANRSDINRLSDKLDRNMESLRNGLTRETAGLRAELIAIRNDHHKDFVSLMSYMVPLHERMAKIEARE